jgi:Domain of unknown function (DUF4126)
VNDILSIGGVLTAFGLAGASGLNAYLPLMVAGLLVKSGYLDIGESYKSLGTWPVIGVVALLLVVDLVGDKIPAVDHVFHAVGTVVHPIAGAIAFASQTGVVKNINPLLAIAIGAATGGSIHLGRAAVRPISTVATGGLATPFVSAAEDVTSGVTTALAFLIPIVSVVVVIWIVWMIVKWRRKAAKRLPPPISA